MSVDPSTCDHPRLFTCAAAPEDGYPHPPGPATFCIPCGKRMPDPEETDESIR